MQAPLLATADKLQRIVDEHQFRGFAGVTIDSQNGVVVLYWKGNVPDPIEAAIKESKPPTGVVVRSADYSLEELLTEARRIAGLGHTRSGAAILGVGPLNDYSGLEVLLDSDTAVQRGPAEIKSSVHIEFKFGEPRRIIPV